MSLPLVRVSVTQAARQVQVTGTISLYAIVLCLWIEFIYPAQKAHPTRLDMGY
jgi:hypothetical protein